MSQEMYFSFSSKQNKLFSGFYKTPMLERFKILKNCFPSKNTAGGQYNDCSCPHSSKSYLAQKQEQNPSIVPLPSNSKKAEDSSSFFPSSLLQGTEGQGRISLIHTYWLNMLRK
jgi:hypothetical protein